MNFTSLRSVTPCILSFNRRDELKVTLNKLLEYGNVWARIIIADNDSSDGTHEMVQQDFPDVQLINTGDNKGVGGWNNAFSAAHSEWVLSLDDDSHPLLDTWAPILSQLEEGTSAAAIALSMCGVKQNQLSRSVLGLEPTAGFSSAGVLLKRDVLARIGGYDPNLFLFTNEIDWAARAIRQGYSLLKCDSAQVVHRAAPLQRSSWRHAYYYCRNLLVWIMKYAPKENLKYLLCNYMQDVCLFTLLHRTSYYFKAFREGRRLFSDLPHVCRLTPAQFSSFRIDFRMPFAYLG